MEVLFDEDFSAYSGGPTALALGTFDGLHRGHRKVIETARKMAREKKLAGGVFSFTPHPRRILNSGNGPGVICSLRQKIEILEEMGLDYFFCQEFTPEFSRTEFEAFVREILCGELESHQLVVGEDFTFGHGGEGTSGDLVKMGEELGFSVKIVSPLKNDDEKISSTRIRRLISAGRVDEVPDLLGRYYTVAGEVVHGSGRGHRLGYPTANLKLEAEYILPRRGVYAGYVHHRGERLKAAANFGHNPTFKPVDYRIEIYILELEENLYGERLSFSPVEFIRPEKEFDSIDKLRETIAEDILYTKKVL